MVRKRDDDKAPSLLRTGQVPEPTDNQPLVLRGPAQQISSRQIRARAVREQHLGPDVKDLIEQGGIKDGSNDNGSFWRLGGLLICTHRLTSLSSGSETWTYPREFSAPPRVSATPSTNLARTATADAITSEQAVIRAFSDSGASSNVNVEVIAIGPDS